MPIPHLSAPALVLPSEIEMTVAMGPQRMRFAGQRNCPELELEIHIVALTKHP